MSLFLMLAFVFFVGSTIGWIIELFFRKFLSINNPEKKWINPGFCAGPYLPIYGFGLCIMYLFASAEKYQLIPNPVYNRVLMFTLAAISATILEYAAGIICLKIFKVRLWDYSKEPGNIQGIICPRFSLIWAAICVIYYFFIHPHILDALKWFSDNLTFSFIIGLFFGIFIIDVCYSGQIIIKLKRFAKENNIIIAYETLKAQIQKSLHISGEKSSFILPFHTKKTLSEHLKELHRNTEINRNITK